MLSVETLPDCGLESLDDKGKPKEFRIKNVAAAHSHYKRLVQADLASADQRRHRQQMFDGEPPYDEEVLRAANQAFRCNLNFDEAGALLETSMTSYVDLINSVEYLISLRTRFGTREQQLEWSEAIAGEFTTMLRTWPQFTSNYLRNCSEFIKEGVSICYFENEIDWRWKVTDFSNFRMPRQTLASEDEIEVAYCDQEYLAHQLWAFIKDPKLAEKQGWNVTEARKAILDAAKGMDQPTHSWEEWQTRAKNNDLGTSAESEVVRVVHAWVKEMDGTVSHMMFLQNGESKDFMFKRHGRFKSMGNAFTIYTYGVGTNGTYHGIRGLGYKIYPHIQVSNQLRCQMVDGAMLASSVILQPSDETDLDKLSLTYFGPYAVIAPGFKAIQTAVPNLSNSVLPVVRDMEDQVRKKTGQYSPLTGISEQRDMSAREYVGRTQQLAELSVAALNLKYEADERLLREVFSRASRRNYPEPLPGAGPVQRMRRRLLALGVPLEALYEVDLDTIRVVRAIGAGSQATRNIALRELTDLAPAYDEIGRKRLVRDRTAAGLGGYMQADRYAPRPEDTRVPGDAKIAELENNQMMSGAVISVSPNELHLTHAQVHVGKINEIVQQANEGQIELEAAVQPLVTLQEHATIHVEQLAGDPMAQEDAALLRQNLQQAGEIILNGMRKLEAEQRKAQAQQQPGQAAPPGAEEESAHQAALRRKLEEHQVKLAAMSAEAELKRSIRLSEAETKRMIEDAKAAADIRNMV